MRVRRFVLQKESKITIAFMKIHLILYDNTFIISITEDRTKHMGFGAQFYRGGREHDEKS